MPAISDLYLGIDFGTSGARAFVIDAQGNVQARVNLRFSASNCFDPSTSLPETWRSVLAQLLTDIPQTLRSRIAAIAINGTSSTVVLCDAEGLPLTEPLMYDDDRGGVYLDELRTFVPADHTVLSATSSLTKLWWWQHQKYWSKARYLLHQADWLAFQLHGHCGISDYHNSLKLGYDVVTLAYPDWLTRSNIAEVLPQVLSPGRAVARILPEQSQRFGLPLSCWICTGTTDSIAAFLASGAEHPGDAVTSLGSTLVLKLLSTERIEDLSTGVYSHRLGDLWLVGGASNTGGAVLNHFFSPDQLIQLSLEIPADQPSPYQYYPLLRPGERFPRNQPDLRPQLEPRPNDRVAFLHGLLESMARIEAEGYALLEKLGATPLQQLYTAGGGADNSAWTAIRQRYLPVPFIPAVDSEAAYGTARLALSATILQNYC